MSDRPSRARLVRLGVSGEYGGQQLALLTLVGLAPVVFFACAVVSGGRLSWWWLVFSPLVLLLVRRPESSGHLVMWAGLLVVWLLAVPGPFTWWCVPAALVVAASHTALTLVAGRPIAGGLAADTWTRVRARLGVVVGVVVAVAVLAQAVRSTRVAGASLVVVLALLAVAGWVWWGGRRVDEVAGEPGPEG